MRWGPRLSQSEGGPLAHAGVASLKAKEAPSPMRRGPRWSQSEGGPLAHVTGTPVVPKRRAPPRPCSGGLGDSKAKDPPSPMRLGPRPGGATITGPDGTPPPPICQKLEGGGQLGGGDLAGGRGGVKSGVGGG